MDKASRNKWQVRLAAVAIFLLGAAAGALAPRAYFAWARSEGRHEQSREDRFEQMLDRLQVNDEQKAQVRQILGDTRAELEALRRETEPRRRDIQRQADERLQRVLTPEQWQQFQQLKDEMRGRGRRGGRGGRGGGPPHEDKR